MNAPLTEDGKCCVPATAGLFALADHTDTHLAAARRLLDNQTIARHASIAARDHALFWSWKNVAARHRSLYEGR